VTFWNKGAEDLWGVRAVEVVNTPLTALDFGLPLDQLTRAIDNVLSGESEREIRDILAVNRRGRSITCHLTIVPLMDRNGETVVGAIIVASDEPVS